MPSRADVLPIRCCCATTPACSPTRRCGISRRIATGCLSAGAAISSYVADVARGYAVTLVDKSLQHAVIAIQGAASRDIVARAMGGQQLRALPYFGFTQLNFAGADCWLARIGYSGETGYELVIADAAAPALWEALRAAGEDDGLLECGFACDRHPAHRGRPYPVYARTGGAGNAGRARHDTVCRYLPAGFSSVRALGARSAGARRRAAWWDCCRCGLSRVDPAVPANLAAGMRGDHECMLVAVIRT